MHINSPAPMASFVLPLMPVLYLWYLVMGLPCMLHPLSCKKKVVLLLCLLTPSLSLRIRRKIIRLNPNQVLCFPMPMPCRDRRKIPPQGKNPRRGSRGVGGGGHGLPRLLSSLAGQATREALQRPAGRHACAPPPSQSERGGRRVPAQRAVSSPPNDPSKKVRRGRREVAGPKRRVLSPR